MLVQVDLLIEYRNTEASFLNTILWGNLGGNLGSDLGSDLWGGRLARYLERYLAWYLARHLAWCLHVHTYRCLSTFISRLKPYGIEIILLPQHCFY